MHLRQADLARIASYLREALIFLARLRAQQHRRFFSRQAHAFQQQALLRQPAEITNCEEGILQVVKQSKAKDEIKSAELQDTALFDISPFERNLRQPPPPLQPLFP